MNNDIIQHITLELNREVSKSSLSVKRNDTNIRRVQVVVTNDGGMMKLDNVVMAIVKGKKPDGTEFWNDCTINGDTIYFVITSQMISVTGDVTCEIEITWLDESMITTPKFNIHVYESISTSVQSTNEYNGVVQALAETINNRTMAETAYTNASASATASENSALASAASATASSNSATEANNYKQTTKDYRDFTVRYVDEFISSIEADNPILGLAKRYTDEKTAPINANIGDMTGLETEVATDLVSAINEVNTLALGRNKSLTANSYEDVVNIFNESAVDEYNAGQNVYVATVGVPDLWVYQDHLENQAYTYTTDAAMLSEIETNGSVHIGRYSLAMLETQKVDLTEINSAIATINAKMYYPQ